MVSRLTRFATGGVVLVAASALAAGALVRAPGGGATSSGSREVIVRAVPGGTTAAAAAVRALGGRVGRSLPLVDGFAARVPARSLTGLAHTPGVVAVTPNARVSMADATYDAAGGSPYLQTSGAGHVRDQGVDGGGVTVAVVDTGVANVPDLQGRLVAGPDFSGGHNSLVDGFGHGTVMAGIVAGDGSAARAAGASRDFSGVAPGARVISVKVAGSNGATDVTRVLAALQWIGTFHAQYGIRVVTLAWGTRSRQSIYLDPLNFAVERLWRRGVVVVVAAGNAGPGDGTVLKPGDDPLVLTAGAFDDGQNADPADDVVPGWSSRGPTREGVVKPDLVAPGTRIIAPVAPASAVARDHPTALIGSAYVRGSGTSQSTAVTAGAAALVLSGRPELAPQQVRRLLRNTASPLATEAATAQGRGRLDVAAAQATVAPALRYELAYATGRGSVEQSRGGRHVDTVCPGASTPTTISGEYDVRCRAWNADSWSADSWSADSWSADSWSADSWSADSWSADSWSADSWSADSWSADSWSADSWSADSWSSTDFLTESWDAAPSGTRR